MKLYMSSYHLGNKTEELKKWISEHNNKICLIPNARDSRPEPYGNWMARRRKRIREIWI